MESLNGWKTIIYLGIPFFAALAAKFNIGFTEEGIRTFLDQWWLIIGTLYPMIGVIIRMNTNGKSAFNKVVDKFRKSDAE